MALERILALAVLTISLIYGYTAFWVMDESLSPFMKFNPVWPSSFPKILALLSTGLTLIILLTPAKSTDSSKAPELDYRRLRDYKSGQALLLLGFMVAYAFALFPIGFVISTFVFITASALVLGESRRILLVVIAAVTSLVVWYLVQQVLGIFLRPWPLFLAELNS